LISLKNAGAEIQADLQKIAKRVLQESVSRTPAFDPKMKAGWRLVESGAIGGPKYNVTVVNVDPRANTKLQYEGAEYSDPEGRPYTLLDVYNYGIGRKYIIAPGVTANSLAFFWVRENRQWKPREGQAVTHPGLPAYHTVDEPRRIGSELVARLRATAKGKIRAVFRGRSRRYNN
jgi:hypothetical protein